MTILITDITESARAIGISFGDYVLDASGFRFREFLQQVEFPLSAPQNRTTP